jgi:hypothetical protein
LCQKHMSGNATYQELSCKKFRFVDFKPGATARPCKVP